MTQAADQVQAAIFAALDSSASISAPVFDAIPEDQRMPYIQLDEPGSREWDTNSDYGKEHEVMIHIYSDYEGKKELNDIMAAIEAELREFTAPLIGHRIVNFRFQFADRLVEPDDQARHGVMQFRVVTEETA